MRGHFTVKQQFSKPLTGRNFIKINKDMCLTLGVKAGCLFLAL